MNSNPTEKLAVEAFNDYDYDHTRRSLDVFIANHSLNEAMWTKWHE
jgi:hypothetical protein